MAQVDIESIVSPATEQRIVLRNSQWAAPLSFGDDWYRIRVTCRFAMDDLGVAPTGQLFYFGLMSNPTEDSGGNLNNGPLDATTSHFVGYVNQFGITRSVFGVPVYRFATNGIPLAKKIDAVTTTIGAGLLGATNAGWSASPSTMRKAWSFELTKGTAAPSTWVCRIMAPWLGAAGGVFDVNDGMLAAGLAQPDLGAAATPVGNLIASATVVTISIDEATNGPLNAVCVAWNRSDILVRISDIYAQRFPTYTPT